MNCKTILINWFQFNLTELKNIIDCSSLNNWRNKLNMIRCIEVKTTLKERIKLPDWVISTIACTLSKSITCSRGLLPTHNLCTYRISHVKTDSILFSLNVSHGLFDLRKNVLKKSIVYNIITSQTNMVSNSQSSIKYYFIGNYYRVMNSKYS